MADGDLIGSALEASLASISKDFGNSPREYYYHRLVQFYRQYNSEKVDQIDGLLTKYHGNEDVLIQRMHLKYGVRDVISLTAIDAVYENERYSYITLSWGSTYPGHLLPQDPHRWQEASTSQRSSLEFHTIEPQLPPEYQWTRDSWKIDIDYAHCDANGWTYASDFSRFQSLVETGMTRGSADPKDYVRRRRWTRSRERVGFEKEVSSTNVSNPPLSTTQDQSSVPGDETNELESFIYYQASDFDDPQTLDDTLHERIQHLKVFHAELEFIRAQKLQRWETQTKPEWTRKIREASENIDALKQYIRKSQSLSSTTPPPSVVDIESKIQLQLRQKDAMKRCLLFPAIHGYALRCSMDGIFVGMKDFWLERLSAQYVLLSSSSSGFQIQIHGTLVSRGDHISVIAEKGTRIPNLSLRSCEISAEFQGTFAYEFIPDAGMWRIAKKESKAMEFLAFDKKIDGSYDLPSSLLKPIVSELVTSRIHDAMLHELSAEFAHLFSDAASHAKLKGEFHVDGPSIQRSIYHNFSEKDDPHIPMSQTQHQSLERLVGLKPSQFRLLTLLNSYQLLPKYPFESIASLLRYYRTIVASLDESLVQTLCQHWQHILEIIVLAHAKQGTDTSSSSPLELFSFRRLIKCLSCLEHKPISYRLTCTEVQLELDIEKVAACVRRLGLRLFLELNHHASSQACLDDYLNISPDQQQRHHHHHHHAHASQRLFRVGRKSIARSSRHNQQQQQPRRRRRSSSNDSLLEQKMGKIKAWAEGFHEWLELLRQNVSHVRFQVEGKSSEAVISVDCHEMEYYGPLDVMGYIDRAMTTSSVVSSSPNGLGPGQVYVQMTNSKSNSKSNSNGAIHMEVCCSSFSVLASAGASLSSSSSREDHHVRSAQSLVSLTIPQLSSNVRVDLEQLMRHYQAQERLTKYYDAFSMHWEPHSEKDQTQYRVTTGKYSAFQLRAQHGHLGAPLRALYDYITHTLVRHIDESYPEHASLATLWFQRLFKYLCSESLVLSFALSGHIQKHAKTDRLVFQLQGRAEHPLPGLVFDQMNLMDIVEDMEDIVDLWLDSPVSTTSGIRDDTS